MAVIKSKLNVFLMVLIVLSLLGLILATLYFQIAIKNANERLNQRDFELGQAKEVILLQIEEIENLNGTYQDLSKDLDSYTTEFEQVYSSCSEENTHLSQELTSTNSALTKARLDLQKKTTELKDYRIMLTEIRMNITETLEYVDEISDQMNQLQSKANNARNDIETNINNDALTVGECKNFLSDLDDYAQDNKHLSEDAESNAGITHNSLSYTNTKLTGIISTLATY